MTRVHVTVRDAVPQDMPALLEVFEELRAAGPRRFPRGGGDPAALPTAVEERYRRAIEESTERLLVAVDPDDKIQGMTLLSVALANNMLEARSVMMGHFVVRSGFRRRGVGRALVAAATAWADDQGIEGVAVTVFPASREANRFYARLGFAPVSIVRLAPVAGLRRRLGSEVPTSGVEEGQGSRRRRLRVGVTSTRSLAAARRQPLG